MPAKQLFRFKDRQGEIEQLLADFRTDCARIAGWNWP
jgi:hypothetical protein